MILRFLRLFARYRELEALVAMQARTLSEVEDSCAQIRCEIQDCREGNAELLREKLLLQDRLDSALADKDQLWATMREAMANERDALRMQVNHAVQKAGGGIPYPDAHALPSNAVRPVQEPGPVGRSGRLLFSERVQRKNHEFAQEYATVMNPDK